MIYVWREATSLGEEGREQMWGKSRSYDPLYKSNPFVSIGTLKPADEFYHRSEKYVLLRESQNVGTPTFLCQRLSIKGGAPVHFLPHVKVIHALYR